MGIVWVFLAIVAIFSVAVVLVGKRVSRRQPLYIGSTAWIEAQWLSEHERAKAAEEHHREDHL